MDLSQKTIGVTGASGMLGAYLCRALLGSGAKVRGVVRNPKKAAFLEREGVELALADLNDRDALADAFRGCDAIVSNAALYRALNMRWSDNYHANKEGTENVYEAMARAGVSRAVHISTFGVYRWHLGRPAIDEQTPTLDGARKQGGAYRATKQLSEALAFELSAKHGLSTTAVRPAGIYGARDENLAPYVRALFRLPFAVLPRFWFPFVHAGDVSNAVVGALKNDASAGKRYLVAGQNTTVYDFFKAYKEASGARTLLMPLPIGTGLIANCELAAQEIGFSNRPFVEGWREVIDSDKQMKALSA